MAEADRLILEAATGARGLTVAELRQMLVHVAEAGFDPGPDTRAGGRLAGVYWQGRVLRASDRLTSAEVHYLRHVVVGQEWPVGTTLAGYLDSIRDVILDDRTGVLTSRYQGRWQLAVIRRSFDLQGPQGYGWILVDYRVDLDYWMTAFQPAIGLRVLRHPSREEIRWLRRPR